MKKLSEFECSAWGIVDCLAFPSNQKFVCANIGTHTIFHSHVTYESLTIRHRTKEKIAWKNNFFFLSKSCRYIQKMYAFTHADTHTHTGTHPSWFVAYVCYDCNTPLQNVWIHFWTEWYMRENSKRWYDALVRLCLYASMLECLSVRMRVCVCSQVRVYEHIKWARENANGKNSTYMLVMCVANANKFCDVFLWNFL